MKYNNELIDKLKIPVTDDILRQLGFSDYDDEHCIWGNRRLMVSDKGNWPNECYKLQIIDQENDEYSGQVEGYFYSGWFELIKQWQTDGHWQLNTIKDIYKVIYLYHKEFLPDFKQLLIDRL